MVVRWREKCGCVGWGVGGWCCAVQAVGVSHRSDSEESEEERRPRARGARRPREEVEPDPLQDDPREDRRLIDRLLDVQPSRPGLTQGQRRLQLERILDWCSAIAITASRVGYRYEWRLSPMPVRWRADDRGVAFHLHDYVSPHGWVPLGQLYGVPPPTDRPLANALGVYPPYEADVAFVGWFARTVRMWRRFRDAEAGLALRRARYAARRQLALRPPAGECVDLCWVQANWELREVAAHCLRWVDVNNPPTEPVTLDRREALPENLHPCGVWGDLLDSPTEREEMGPPPVWPPPDLEALGTPGNVGLVVPAVRGPAEREERAVAVPRPSATAPVAAGEGPVTRRRRGREEETPAAARTEEPALPATRARRGSGGAEPSQPSTGRAPAAVAAEASTAAAAVPAAERSGAGTGGEAVAETADTCLCRCCRPYMVEVPYLLWLGSYRRTAYVDTYWVCGRW